MDKNKNATIMVVDDNMTNLRVVVQFLTDCGYETWVATNGEDAISQLEFALPDLILLDIMMPGIDGFETCKRIKENKVTSDIPIIFMTALSEIQYKIKGFQYGAVDYITKPFQAEEVLARITTHLTVQNQKIELSCLNSKLTTSNATKDKFFSIIAHDMRNVFNSLLISVDTLTKIAHKTEIDNIIKFSEIVKTSATNAHKLLENLLDWSRIQRGVMNYKPDDINIAFIVNSNLDLLKQQAAQKGIELSSSIDPIIMAYADLNMFDTILRNLISNALKFTPKDNKVTVSAEIEDDMVKISVADTGIGIRKDDVDKLFRVDKKFKQKGTAGEHGTGLGLILCKELVEKNNGNIWVESEPGKGSTFIFTLQTKGE